MTDREREARIRERELRKQAASIVQDEIDRLREIEEAAREVVDAPGEWWIEVAGGPGEHEATQGELRKRWDRLRTALEADTGGRERE